MQKKFSIVDVLLYIFLILFSISILVPIWRILVVSTSSEQVYITDKLHLIPKSLNLNEYRRAFYSIGGIARALFISAEITILGTFISMILSLFGAYALSKKELPGNAIIFRILIFTMFFSGGMVPGYVLVRNLRLMNTIFAIILPGAISTYNLILIKNYFIGLPESLEEAAKIDGYNDIQILFKVVIPVSTPVIAAISLFYGVGYWNEYFRATLYINSNRLYPLQVVLRQMIIQNQMLAEVGIRTAGSNTEQFKMACIIIGMIPVLAVYPFIQKYFTKGVMLGAVKG